MVVARIIVDCALLVIAFLFPWWFSLVLAIICLFVFNQFFEILILGLVIDSLYNAPVTHLYRFQFAVTFAALILFIGIEYAKTQLRFHR